jgi:N-acetylmuramoyl-L-alanine amidase
MSMARPMAPWSSRAAGRRAFAFAAVCALGVPVVRSEPASTATSTSAPASTSASASTFAPAFVVALDPGHGGSNLGAVVGDGLKEKGVTLALARRLRARLQAASGVEVVLCRSEDVLVPIRARARCAATAHAQLFLSLHTNAAPPGVVPGSQRGFELYVLSPAEIEDDATLAALAAPSTAEGAWAGHQVRAAGERAVAAAHLIDVRLRQALGARAARGIRQSGAAVDVLRGTRAAGVLVEVGFLDNEQERAGLASAAGQDRIADAIAQAVLDFRSAALR